VEGNGEVFSVAVAVEFGLVEVPDGDEGGSGWIEVLLYISK